ncbi:DUF1835 domain-containing protein, partial [Bacillus sp. JJ722]|uniref:DUF1835 domain-containing protein n=1 Tax=Bacillus sp. JJ722 TaxID=3122973 RepID=UPI002FFE72C9
MTEKLRKAVDYLSDNEARNLLMTILSGVDVLDKQQFFDRIKNIQEELLNEFQNQSEQQVGNYHTVHFTFSRSTSGSLNRALQQIKKDQEEKVIALADLFSVGPIGRLQKQSGFIQRYAWLQDHLHHYIEELDDFFNYYTITLLAINRISEHIRIVIWSGDNAHEQTGLAYLLYLLKEKRNDIYIMDAPYIFNKQTNNSECKHTSRVPFKAYQELLPSTYELKPLTNDLRLEYENVWEQLTSTDEKLRIMQNGKIRSV